MGERVEVAVKVSKKIVGETNMYMEDHMKIPNPSGWKLERVAQGLMTTGAIGDFWRLYRRISKRTTISLPKYGKVQGRNAHWHELSFYNIKNAGPSRSIIMNTRLDKPLDHWTIGTKFYKVLNAKYTSDILRNYSRNKALGPDLM